MHTTPRIAPSTGRSPRTRSKRGVAMLMVLVCMVVGTIMAGVALTTQDSSPQLGENACDTAASAWAAESAADLAVAAMQTQADWTDGDSNLFTNFTFAGAKVSVVITDMEGNPPDDNDRELIMTATGVVGGVSTKVQKRIMVTPPADLSEAIDPHLGEYAVFAKSRLTIQSGATISEWLLSPEAGTSMPVKIGTGFASAADLSVAADATLSRVKVYTDSFASTALDNTSATAAPSSAKVPLKVPAVPELMPSAITSLSTMPTALNYNSVHDKITTAARYTALTVQNNAVLTIDGSKTPCLAFNSLGVRTRGIIRIKGDVAIGVFGNTTINTMGAIEFEDAASTLLLYTTGNITIDNAGIGLPDGVALNASRSPKDVSAYINAGRVKILPVSTASGGAAAPTITVGAASIICGNIHAPTATVALNSGSWIVGRLTGNIVTISTNSGIFYDPRYDNRVAFTNRNGPFYKSDGNPVDGLVDALASFNPLSGAQSLRTLIPSAVASLTAPVTEVVSGVGGLVGGLLGGGSSPISSTPPVSPRTKQRAEARPLPMMAMSLEGKQTVAAYDDDVSSP